MAAQIDPFLLHPTFILREGLSWAKIALKVQQRRCDATNVRIFKSHYGRHPRHLARVWRDMQIAAILDVEEAALKDSFHAFLIANNFLKCYERNDVRFSRFSDYHDKQLIEMTWRFVDYIESLAKWKIKCPNKWPVRMGCTVDGSHFRINEPRDPDMRRNPTNFSYKHNFAGLNYQIAIATWTNKVLYVNTGDPSSTHDMTAIRKEFIDLVPAKCRVIADSGYTGKSDKEKEIFSVANNMDSDEVKLFKARARARQEQFNSRMENYACMANRFIHGIEKHRKCFASVAVLVQYAIEDTSSVGEPLDTL